ERAVKTRGARATIDASVDALEASLGALVAALARALPADEGGPRTAVDAATLGALCARLQALLADDDSEAAEVFAEHAVLLRSAFPRHFGGIDGAIKAFEFDAARAALTEAAAASS